MSGESDSRENVVENIEAKKDVADQPEKQFLDPDKVVFSSLCGRGVITLPCSFNRQMKWHRLSFRRGMAS